LIDINLLFYHLHLVLLKVGRENSRKGSRKKQSAREIEGINANN
jgi:hypothetical protein